jgi:molybdate transport system ATP-binding protein
MGLQVNIRKKIGNLKIDVEFHCPEGKTLALIGPSGAGKTTIIRMLAGLERPDEGRIVHNGNILFDSQQNLCLPPQKRNLGYVFQDYMLFPHLTLYGNADFAAKDKEEVENLVNHFGLSHLKNRKPHQVSGGERQRCAICQALARRPRLLLLDEPFSALDVVTRRGLRATLNKIKEEKPLSILYVTHDIHDALYMANTTIPIVGGKVDHQWLERIVLPLSPFGNQLKATREPKLALVY